MSDLTDRLAGCTYWTATDESFEPPHEHVDDAPFEAAKEIRRLRAALREIRDWRLHCRDGGIMEWEPVLDWIEDRCHKALGDGNDS